LANDGERSVEPDDEDKVLDALEPIRFLDDSVVDRCVLVTEPDDEGTG
jgi:hypothetical protein